MKKFLSIFAFLLILAPTMTFAADFRKDSVGENDKVQNLYIAGENVTVDADVQSDLNSAGRVVSVSGDVQKSSNVTGSTVTINGNTGGNLRVAGGTVIINGDVAEDLVVFGGDVTIGKDSVISKDLIIFSGNVTIDGTVNGRLIGGTGEFRLNGTINGDVDLKGVGTIALGNNSAINGKLVYGAEKELNFDKSKVKNGVEFKKITTAEKDASKSFFGFSIFAILGSFLLLLVISKLAPKTTEKYIETAVLNPWLNLGLGFLTLVVAPIALLFLLITVVGLPFAGIGFLIYLLLISLSGLFGSLLAGSWLVKVIRKEEKYEIGWIQILTGVVIAALLKLIPVFGWFVLFGLFLVALGVFTKMLYTESQLQRK